MFGINTLAKKFFGSANDRIIRTITPIIEQINTLEPEFEKLSDDALKAKTDEFRKRLKKDETLDDILPEAFATVREAAKRTLGQRHYDMQLIGGVILHRGMIAEMKTGEGKTLVSTLATYLNAIEGRGVHLVTVNEYLAERDSKWMGQIHEFLGLSVGCITNKTPPPQRQEAYNCDITYGTNNEFGFDYLRDNMRFAREEMVQREFNFAIVDEVDSILIDEARTPLIISGPIEDNTKLYNVIDKYIPKLKESDYELDEKSRGINLTEEGTVNIEAILLKDGVLKEGTDLYDIENIAIVHHVNQALRAHHLFTKDKDYIIKDNKVILIDEFTGRMMEGRRLSEGLHQAIEAKEGAPIQNENQTLASITFQNYFRMYPKLSGMTGTAMTEAAEFSDIYKLEVIAVPTNIPITRIDDEDDIYRTAEEKYAAIIELIEESNKKQQPVLVGTASIERSEYLSSLLKKKKIKHNVLNARYHQQEAKIIGQAGQPSAVTIATNMAGRGTDIQLGGNLDMIIADKIKNISDKKKVAKITSDITKQVAENKKIVTDAGGLCVIGTERHESRRIDNQLRGRSGRQGDAGYTKFFLSSEDDLIRVFGADKKMDWVLGSMGQEGKPIAHPLLTKMMEKSQEKIEARNYEVRKTLLKFDDVMNDQRSVIYDQRIELMDCDGHDSAEMIEDMWRDLIESLVSLHIPEKAYAEQWDVEGMERDLFRIFGLNIPVIEWSKKDGIAEEEILKNIEKEIENLFAQKKEKYDEDMFNEISKRMLLFTLDELWKDHLLSLDQLKQGIGLRQYAQKDPLNEYKSEAFKMFQSMLEHLKEVIITRISHMEMRSEGDGVSIFDKRQVTHELRKNSVADKDAKHAEITSRKPGAPFDAADPSTWGRVGRNESCPCGSGKKFKQCHGKI